MYLVGAPHPNKEQAQALLRRLVQSGRRLVTDAEVYQEILHRYGAINRPEAIGPAFAVLDGVVDECLDITREVVDQAHTLLDAHPGLSARDAVHLAAMTSNEVTEILSFDAGFDLASGITRLC
jgi:uncharacterized protein